MVLLFVALLQLQAIIAQNTSTYSLVKAGTCDAVSRRTNLLDAASCSHAAAVVDVHLSTSSVATMGESNPYPFGCSVDYCCDGAALRLQPHETDQWGGSQPDCTQSNPCLCLSGVDNCTHTDNSQSNDAPCACGSAACTSVSGLFCTSATSACSRGSTCDHVDGVTPNTVSCACGLTDSCNAFNGMYCFSNARFSVVSASAIDFCSVIDGSAPNTGDCQCGSTRCTSDTGRICYSQTGRGSCRATGLGAYGYEKVFSGYCNSVAGSVNIKSTEECATAAKSLGLSDTKPEEIQLKSAAVGCTWKDFSGKAKEVGLTFHSIGVELNGEASKCDRETTYCICVSGDPNAGDPNAGDPNAGDANAGDANAGDANASPSSSRYSSNSLGDDDSGSVSVSPAGCRWPLVLLSVVVVVML